MSNNTTGDVNLALTPYNVLTTVIGVVAVILNGLLLIAMIRSASTIFTSNGAYLVANVAIADLLTGLNSSFWGLHSAVVLPRPLKIALFSLFWTSIEASFLTIFIMSFERYFAIVYPFAADVWLSKTRTIQSGFLVWVFSGLCGALMAFYRESVTFFLMCFFEITILVTTCFYYKIFIRLGQRKACLPLQLNDERTRGKTNLQREYQLTTVVVVLTLILIITVLPYMIAGQIELASVLFNTIEYPELGLFVHYYLPVELMNFVLNPIVYAWRLPKYRHALLKILQFR